MIEIEEALKKELNKYLSVLDPIRDTKIDKYNLEDENARLSATLQLYYEAQDKVNELLAYYEKKFSIYCSNSYRENYKILQAEGVKTPTTTFVENKMKQEAKYWDLKDKVDETSRLLDKLTNTARNLFTICRRSIDNLVTLYQTAYYTNREDVDGHFKAGDVARDRLSSDDINLTQTKKLNENENLRRILHEKI